ncbi:MAG: hypothetical protein QOG23_1902 [Blastocatellia bacterium]|jgi:hypothetical protein|nr:hypothetical protein [Blastocatellia bacterium]
MAGHLAQVEWRQSSQLQSRRIRAGKAETGTAISTRISVNEVPLVLEDLGRTIRIRTALSGPAPDLTRQRRQACSYLSEKIYAFRRPFLILFACPE